jgi:hypothetical protein
MSNKIANIAANAAWCHIQRSEGFWTFESIESEIEKALKNKIPPCNKCEGFGKSVGVSFCKSCGRELPDE